MIIRKLFKFEGAHIVRHCSSEKCRENIHGHSYRLEVTVCSPALDSVEPGRYIESDKADPKNGMLFDFSELKKCVNQSIVDVFDHTLILNREGNAEIGEMLKTRYQKVFCVPFQPTSENLLLDFAGRSPSVRLLYLSSGAVYGPQPEALPFLPETYQGIPGNAYGKGKLEAEETYRGCLSMLAASRLVGP